MLAGIFQLFVLYHHRLALAPMLFPLNCAVRFQNRHPCSTNDQTVPCNNGIMTYPISSAPTLQFQVRGEQYLISNRNPCNSAIGLCARDAC
jgi:hypothetical protein